MTLKLKNSWSYQGNDWWKWQAFIDDEGSGALQDIERVEYLLHPTFPNPVRSVEDSQGGFRLETAGWGVFELKAVVYTKDGDKQQLTHQLQLARNPEEGVSD